MPVLKICRECGADFKVPPVRAATAFYCSKKCANLHRGDALRKERVKLICANCGGEYEAFPSHAHRRKYCSYKCKDRDWTYRMSLAKTRGGESNVRWKGGRVRHSDGYVYLAAPHHPFTSNGYVFEHRLVMEFWLREHDPDSKFLVQLGDQKYLSPKFVVHHDDEDKTNNDIANLVCMTNAEHRRHHNAESAKPH